MDWNNNGDIIVEPGLSASGGIWDSVQMGFSGAFYFAKVGLKF